MVVALTGVVLSGQAAHDVVTAAPSEDARKKAAKGKTAVEPAPAAAAPKSGAPQKSDKIIADPPPPAAAAKEPQKPLTPLGPPPPPEAWSPDEIKEALAECSKLFRGQSVKFEPLEPIREGTCGAPAPVKVEGFSSEPQLEIRPAAIMTCKMTAALNEWLERFVQPRAKELLHANIIRISNVASYHCRHRYNDPMQRMSNHAYAGALDIAEFMTAKGERINILEHWPLDDARSKFLKDIHKGACEIFGTTLGPEANEAHRNHFHLDTQTRRKPYCDGIKDKRKKESAEAEVPVQQPKTKAGQNAATKPSQKQKQP